MMLHFARQGPGLTAITTSITHPSAGLNFPAISFSGFGSNSPLVHTDD